MHFGMHENLQNYGKPSLPADNLFKFLSNTDFQNQLYCKILL